LTTVIHKKTGQLWSQWSHCTSYYTNRGPRVHVQYGDGRKHQEAK